MSFIHLRTNTDNSLTQGISTIKGLVKKAAADNQPALAITDLNGMFGVIQFYSECRAKGVKPILGVDMTVDNEPVKPMGEDASQVFPESSQILVLAKNTEGYKSLLELHSRGYIENRTKETVAIKEDWMKSLKDCVVLSGGINGKIAQLIIADRYDEAKELAEKLKSQFGDDFYIELQRDGSEHESKYMEGAVRLCVDLGIAPVATHPNYFLESEDFLAHEARYCSANKKLLYDVKRSRPFNKEMYFKTTQEMEELFSDIPVALENTHDIALKCSTTLVLNKPQLPHFPTENGMNVDDYFEHISKEGLKVRMIDDFPDEKERASKLKEYEDRLNYEIGVIKQMGFPGYFLIVSDFITWAKRNNIPVGPGRGSGAGSLVAYALQITNLDPIPYKLIFERFLNPERVSMPDFDIDFCQLRRTEVIEYVRKKYGKDAVSQISSYGTIGAKSAVKDAARLLDFHSDFGDNITKAMPSDPTDKTPLETLVFGEDNESKPIPPHADFLERYNNETDFRKVMDIAMKLEGLLRNIGTHAAGVVISPTTMSDFSPIFTLDNNNPTSSQFDKDDVEKAGLVKFDFLGLKNLTSIKEAVDMINKVNKANGQEEINIDKINLNDPEVFKSIFHDGNTGSVFQFESAGMKSIMRDAKPTNIEDLIAINALYRPGPMSIIPAWLEARKLPEEQREYAHPLLKEALKETCGFMIYQEQVMQCAQILAGYSLGGADILRRAMGKKKPEEMAKQRAIFIEGCGKNNVDEHKAGELFDLIEKFSGYGFNKSHAAAYSLLAYQTAFLKHYYPQEFFMATMNSALREDDTDAIALSVVDCRKNGVDVLPVDINSSNWLMKIDGDGNIRYGLGAIKGVGEGPATAIEKDRELNGPFTNFYNFIERASAENFLNKRAVESLVAAGAFDSIHPNRGELFANIGPGIHYGSELKKHFNSQKSAIGDNLDAPPDAPKVKRTRGKVEVTVLPKPEFIPSPAWDDMEVSLQEKKAYSYYFSSNPYENVYEKQLDGLKVKTPLEALTDAYERGEKNVFIAGIFSEFKLWKSKTGGFLTITDGVTSQNMMMYLNQYEDAKEWLKKDAFVGMQVELQTGSDNAMKIKIVSVNNFDKTREMLVQKAFLAIEPEKLDEVKEKLLPYIANGSGDDSIPLIICQKPNKDNEAAIKLDKLQVAKTAQFMNFCVSEFGTDFFKCKFLEQASELSSNHYKSVYAKQLDGLKVSTPLANLEDAYKRGEKNVFIAGLFSDFKLWKSKTGGFLTIDDGVASQKMMMYLSQYDEVKDWLVKDAFVGMQVELQTGNDGEMKIKIVSINDFDKTREMLLQKSFLAIEPEKINEVKEKIAPFITNTTDKSAAIPLVICTKPQSENEKSVEIEKVQVVKSAKFMDFCITEFGADCFKSRFIEQAFAVPQPRRANQNWNKNR